MRFVERRGARRVGRGIGRGWRAERTRRVGSASDHGMTSWRYASVSRAAVLVPAEPPALASFFGAPETEARLGGDAGRYVLAPIMPTSICVGEDDPGVSPAPAASRLSAADRVSIAGEASRRLGHECECAKTPNVQHASRPRLARPRDAFPSVGASPVLFVRCERFPARRVRRARCRGARVRGRAVLNRPENRKKCRSGPSPRESPKTHAKIRRGGC